MNTVSADGEGFATWNHRTLLHIDSRYPGEEYQYLAVHEVHYENGKPHAFTTRAIAPHSKREAEHMVRAFDKPPVAWVDDADEDKWGWIGECVMPYGYLLINP